MLPTSLITFREVIEASLIVATILGMLAKLGQHSSIKTVWWATAAATSVSALLLGIGSLLGLRVQEVYESKEALIQGSLSVISAVFITWAVFFLHTYFAHQKVKLLQKVRETVVKNEQRGIFLLVFAAVMREGIEIVLFLTTIYFSSNPQEIFSGFSIGILSALLISFGLFSATLKLPVYYAFRATSALLILFAAGMLAQGVHEFVEIGLLPEVSNFTIGFIPDTTSIVGSIIHAVFGVSRSMDWLQVSLYGVYVAFMGYWIFIRKVSFDRHD